MKIMRIIQVTPSGQKSKSGNRTTAKRWAHIFRNLGHNVVTSTKYDGRPADMMVAIHAWRSAAAIERFKILHPEQPLVVCLAGTDINQFIHTHPRPTLRSMELADAMVCLHNLVKDVTPSSLRPKLQVIYQSAKPLPGPRRLSSRNFNICVASHLREGKDPMRTALAARGLPKQSRIRVTHLGMAHNQKAAEKATAEMTKNPRYIWKGEVPGWRVRQEFKRAHLMVISSRAEGGANVISEAVVAGVPIIASNIEGNIGLLGKSYGGYYPMGDTNALRDLMLKAEGSGEFVERLAAQCRTLESKFTIEHEQETWRKLIAKLI